MKDKLKEVYERLQALDIKPTKGNMEKLLQCLYDLQDVYNELERMEANNGGQAADPGGRDDD